MDEDGPSRRLALAMGIAGGLSGLAGCGGDVDLGSTTDDSADGESDGESDDESETAERSPLDARSAGTGVRVTHDGSVVFGGSSPREITSKRRDELRSQLPIYAPAFHTTSALTAKTGVEPVDTASVLSGVESLTISRWRLSATGRRHVGPMAGEFQATFDLDASEPAGSTPNAAAETIATVDADGVVLAAIQGYADRLAARNRMLETEVRALDERIEALRSRMDAVAATVDDRD